MNRKPLVLVVCGAGTLTSVIASQGVEQGLKKRGITDVDIVHNTENRLSGACCF